MKPWVRILALAAFTAAPGTPAPADVETPADLRAADALASQPAGKSRDRALERWAKNAALGEILYVMRRPASELGRAEARLAKAALEIAPESRIPLRRRLIVRRALADPKWKPPREEYPGANPPLHPRASVFKVAALLPGTGNYESYGTSVLQGIEAGLAGGPEFDGPEIELEVRSTGDDQPDRVLAAFDSVAADAGAVVGELLSVPTLVLATATRFGGLPLVSPTATDESVGAMGPMVFQIGPSGFERGLELARVALRGESPRVAVLVSSQVEKSSFVRGFVAGVEAQKAPLVWRDTYPSGSSSFGEEARALASNGVEVLFWDGDAREIESILGRLARERISLRVCGGEPLAPNQHHAENRVLLEGVQYVAESWALGDPAQARFDSLMSARSVEPSGPLQVHGYLAGRLLRAAVRAGSLCPEETAEFLASRTATSPYLRSHGFLSVRDEGAVLPVYTVVGRRAVPVQ